MSAPTPAPGDDRPREGYYPDPSIPGYVRYWNGASWVPGTSRPAPTDGEPLAPPPGARPAAPSVEETGPHFFDEDPRPGPSGQQQAWGTDPRFPAEPPGHATGTAAVPPAEDTAPDPGGTFIFRRPVPGPAAVPDDGTMTFRPTPGGHPGPSGRPAADGPAGRPSGPAASGTPGFGAHVADPRSGDSGPAFGPQTSGPGAGGPGAQAPNSAAGGYGPGVGSPAAGTGFGAQTSGPGAGGYSAQAPDPAAGGYGPGAAGGPGSAGPGGQGSGSAAAAAGGPGAGGYGPGAAGGGPGPAGPGAQQAASAAAGGFGAQGPVGTPSAQSGQPAAGAGFGAGKAAAARAAAAQAPQASAAAAVAPSVPQQAGAGATPLTSGPGGGQASWAQQVHRLAGGADEQPVAPWKPPVEDPFQAVARRQASARPAGLGKRFAARLIDSLVIGAVTAAAAVPLGARAVDHVQHKIDEARLSGRTVTVWLIDGTTGTSLGIVLAVLLLVGVLYEVLPTAKWGRTLGKKLCGLEVRDIEAHEPPAFGAALRRWLVYSVPGLLGIGIVGVLWCVFDRPWHQCWHDKAARTFVAG
ncbi:RDD family protein [Streptomyces sp. NPDC005728]|uniref:RDD family protein n=1 Tax=Streptomyces sp. NPDC005728 TaxID=3157054 RepID=UPI0033C57B44